MTNDNYAVTRRNADTDWFSQAQLGTFMHYLPNQQEFEYIPQFDVKALADQLADAGAAYLCFTLGQNIGFYNAPNPVYDSIVGVAAGERCSLRDLPMELGKALRERNIRLKLYLPCQTPNRDLQAVKAFGFPEEPLNGDRQILPKAAEKWAEAIAWWSVHYGELVSGWWFDGGYEWCGFNDATAALYSSAVKKGNPHSIATFNPGISLRRATAAEDYVAGEIRKPFELEIDERWLDDSQTHVLTFLGDEWGVAHCRHKDDEWIPWLRRCFRAGAVVTLDMRGNRDPKQGPVGLFDSDQIAQFKRLREATRL